MATLRAHGISAALPSGFEGRIGQRQTPAVGVTNAVAQFSTFALPSRGRRLRWRARST